MQRVDLRIFKNELREESKKYRREMSKEDKAERDLRIRRRLQTLYQYPGAKTILCYTSKAIEVDTFGIIQDAWDAGKQVAVPRCVDGTRLMEFYLIKSFDDLEVLKGITMEVKRGEVVAVIGPSGGGKSTLLRCATTLEKVDAGKIVIGGDVLC